METKVIRVTPSLATNWLESNTINRPLRKSVVEGYVAAYMRGEHRLTHQGIAFADTGELLDGQHRLTAISQMPSSFGADMLVTRGLPRSAFEAIDQGLKRAHSDVLHVPQGQAAVARYLATIHETSRIGITSQFLIPFVEGIETPYMRLFGFCPKATKTWSSAAIRSAAVLQMLSGGDRDYICLAYYSLNHMDFESMPAVVQALFRQQAKGLVSARGYDMFCRAFKAFDAHNANLNTIQINDTSTLVSKAREIIKTKVLGTKKAPTSGAKKVNGLHSRAKLAA